MPESPNIILWFIGDLLTRGEDWDLSGFSDLFQRLENKVDCSGSQRRYIRYFGETGEKTEVRFFGTTVDSLTPIPHGLVSFELSEKEITIYKQEDDHPVVSWKSRLTWYWLDRSNPQYPLGEFTTGVPINWLSGTGDSEVRFILSANSYSQQGEVPDDEVHLVDYDPAWPDRYEEMASRLRNTISPDIVLRIERYGSTAIPGIPAKPVIDILMEVPSFPEARRNLIPLFNRLECEYWWYDEHMLFIVRDESTGVRTHHIHAAPKGHRVWEGLAFRDYLRTHPDEAQRYADLKYKLAESYSNNREAYTGMKADFVREIISKASKHN
jgi:GrpB-like predicted nucleotidyltransferase (UPF0157 family)